MDNSQGTPLLLESWLENYFRAFLKSNILHFTTLVIVSIKVTDQHLRVILTSLHFIVDYSWYKWRWWSKLSGRTSSCSWCCCQCCAGGSQCRSCWLRSPGCCSEHWSWSGVRGDTGAEARILVRTCAVTRTPGARLASVVHLSVDEVTIGTIVTSVESYKPLALAIWCGTTTYLWRSSQFTMRHWSLLPCQCWPRLAENSDHRQLQTWMVSPGD